MENYRLTTKDKSRTLFAGFFKDFKTCLEEAIRRNIPLYNIDLSNKNLMNANLDDGIFGLANFSNCNLTGANMSECYLKDATFSSASLFNTCFAYSNLSGCNFTDAQFGATDITGCILDKSQFSSQSAYFLSFSHSRQMKDCVFTFEDGETQNCSTPPVVISGIAKKPIILMQNQAYQNLSKLNDMQTHCLIKEALASAQKQYEKILT